MNKASVFSTLLKTVITNAEKEREIILNGGNSLWSLGQIQTIIIPEMQELLSYAVKGTIFFKYGKKQRLLQSTYCMTDSFNGLNNTALGKTISEVQRLYNSL